MYKMFSVFSLLLMGAMVCNGQSKTDTAQVNSIKTKLPQKTASITLHMERIAGIGPDGHVSSSQGTLAHLRKYEGGKNFPEMKNIPAGLKDVQEYCYVLDLPQFTYQSYLAGLCSKDYMEKHLSGNKFDLKDTVLLSKKPLKCYVSAISGKKDSAMVYMIDADNDGDFKNDILRSALTGGFTEEAKIKGSVPVKITYLNNNNKIIEDTRSVFMGLNQRNEEMYFSFPEFNYLRFVYKGILYMAVTGDYNRSAITVVPDRPYFDRIANRETTRPGQYVKLGDDEFILSKIINNGNDLILTGTDVSGFGDKAKAKGATAKIGTAKTSNKTSRQLGYLAPVASGININPAIKAPGVISTANFKGKYVFIDVWSTYCGPCIAEFPYLKEVYSKFNRKDLEIIALVDDIQPNTTQQILQDRRLGWVNIALDAATSRTIGYKDIKSYPSTYLLDRNGRIIDIDLRGEDLMNRLKLLIKGS